MRGLKAKTGLLFAAVGVLAGCAEDPVTHEPVPDNPVVFASHAPPPISGGTLLVTRDGHFAVAADPDRDRVWVVDLESETLLHEIVLQPAEEPGRVIEGPDGLAYVVLRRGGGYATVDVQQGSLVSRTSVCASPRGLAFDGDDTLYVTCSGGELVTRSVSTNTEVDRQFIIEDLRDVIFDQGRLWLTRFRAAEVIRIDLSTGTQSINHATWDSLASFRPSTAYRAVAAPGGGVVIIHQRSFAGVVGTTPDAYSTNIGCADGVVQSAVSVVQADGSVDSSGPVIRAFTLPVDIAISEDGAHAALISAGSNSVWTTAPSYLRSADSFDCAVHSSNQKTDGQPIAVAYRGNATVIQLREPPRLLLEGGHAVELPGETMADTGHNLFHQPADVQVGLACASCHPEGRDDGQVWNFVGVGDRRTQSLAGGVLATAPLHWDGDLPTFDTLMTEVFTNRMSGPKVGAKHAYALSQWVDSVPAVLADTVQDADAVTRGKAVFDRADVGCANCHAGGLFTDNRSYNVGTGGTFQTPSLRGVGARAPYMHNGCALTLEQRFYDASCGGANSHGKTIQLNVAEVTDLIAYLKAL